MSKMKRHWVLGAMVVVLMTGGGISMVAPHDASGQSDQSAIQQSANGETNFGTAVPSDKFVQSFQQQVSQQLQSALSQSTQSQESKLQEYETQQKQLEDKVQTLQQSVDAAMRGDNAARATTPSNDVDAPHVSQHRSAVPDPSIGVARASNPTDSPAMTAPTASDLSAETMAARISDVSNDAALPFNEPNIAPHGFVEGRLLNGVVAVVGGPDRESVVALNGAYQSANGFTSDLDGCFALVQGKPEISAGRIDFKLSRLTCNFPDGGSRTWDTAGWLVDSDGIRGVRALIVENLGRKAAFAAVGGAVGAVGQRLSQQQYEVNAYAGGATGSNLATTATFVGSSSRDAVGGAATGAANAMTQSLADYYNLFTPSLQVGGGTRVTVVLANDLRVPPSGRSLTPTHRVFP
jgi:TolA-binding protein